MADSPSHKFGQIIGDLLEEIMEPHLQSFCDVRGLYLDKKGTRGRARQGKKVTWEDKFGNFHDLDFVIEKGGTSHEKGRPIAFIEAAWRRYTKHSRNKTQEIQGAILPIAEKYYWDKPFLGTVLAGEFTSGSLTQMLSSGFEVMYFPYETVVKAFSEVGINAEFDEQTPDSLFKETIVKFEQLNTEQHDLLKASLIKQNSDLLLNFLNTLAKVLDRMVDRVVLIPLHGPQNEFHDIDLAKEFINKYDTENYQEGIFRKFEIIVWYNNGSKIDAQFTSKDESIRFLEYISS